MTAVAAVTGSRDALLGPASQRLELGLLSARTAAVLRRIADGFSMDEIDLATLCSAIEMLEATADAVEVVSAGGQLRHDRRSFGFGAMAFTVELATNSVAPADLLSFLRGMAGDLRQLAAGSTDVASRLLPAFSTLADVATRQAGSVGEGSGSLI